MQRPYAGRLPHHAAALLVVLVGNFVVAVLCLLGSSVMYWLLSAVYLNLGCYVLAYTACKVWHREPMGRAAWVCFALLLVACPVCVWTHRISHVAKSTLETAKKFEVRRTMPSASPSRSRAF